jgi:hypothetical protein
MAYAGEIEISVVLYEDDCVWIAQGVEFDITVTGNSPSDAARRFDAQVAAELIMSFECGDKHPLSGIGAAPQKFWKMFREAKELIEHERAPVRILDDGYSPVYRPRMKIGEQIAA